MVEKAGQQRDRQPDDEPAAISISQRPAPSTDQREEAPDPRAEEDRDEGMAPAEPLVESGGALSHPEDTIPPLSPAPADSNMLEGLWPPARAAGLPAASPGAVAEAAVQGAFASTLSSDRAAAADAPFDGRAPDVSSPPCEATGALSEDNSGMRAPTGEPDQRGDPNADTAETGSGQQPSAGDRTEDPAEAEEVAAALASPGDPLWPRHIMTAPLQERPRPLSEHTGTQTPPRGRDAATSTASSLVGFSALTSTGVESPHTHQSMLHLRGEHLRSYTGGIRCINKTNILELYGV
jgi:hypothetical protein